MSATTIATPHRHTSGPLRRILNVVRLHVVNKSQIVVVPWMIMGFIFVVTMLIGLIFRNTMSPADLADTSQGMQYSGAIGYFLVYMLVIAVMSISQTFPFAQSYSVTRRDFYIGTVITFIGLSVLYSLAITVLGWLEDITHGWGLNVVLFSPGYLSSNLVERFYISVVLFLFFFMVGVATASVYVRWKVNGMLIFFAILALFILGLMALATITATWSAVGAWFATMGFTGVVSWTLLPTALATVAGYFLLRRATPRN